MRVARRGLSILIGLLALTAAAQGATIKTAEDLIGAMRKKYANTWYKTTTFKQVTTDIDKDGSKKEAIWYEAISMPGRLRIDFDPVKDGNGALFVNDKFYTFKYGKLVCSWPFVLSIVFLALDVYYLPFVL